MRTMGVPTTLRASSSTCAASARSAFVRITTGSAPDSHATTSSRSTRERLRRSEGAVTRTTSTLAARTCTASLSGSARCNAERRAATATTAPSRTPTQSPTAGTGAASTRRSTPSVPTTVQPKRSTRATRAGSVPSAPNAAIRSPTESSQPNEVRAPFRSSGTASSWHGRAHARSGPGAAQHGTYRVAPVRPADRVRPASPSAAAAPSPGGRRRSGGRWRSPSRRSPPTRRRRGAATDR